VAIVQLLVNKGADVNQRTTTARGITPLMEASGRHQGSKRHSAVVEMLLAHGVSPNVATLNFGLTPLHAAAERGPVDIVEMLINKGADVNRRTTTAQGDPPLMWASQQGRSTVVEMLLAHGASPNVATLNFGLTPLHAAAERGPVDTVEMLANKGALRSLSSRAVHPAPCVP